MGSFNNCFPPRKRLEPLLRNFGEKFRTRSRTNNWPPSGRSVDHAVKQKSARLDNSETLFKQILLFRGRAEPNPCVPDLIPRQTKKDNYKPTGHVTLQNTIPFSIVGPASYAAFVAGPLVIPSETITSRHVMRENRRFEFGVRVASCLLQARAQGECDIIRNIHAGLMSSRSACIIRAESLPENDHFVGIQDVKQRLKLILRSHRSRFPVRLLIRSRVPAFA